jgi:molecular chaperone DnaJ
VPKIEFKNYYDVLGVNRTADEKTIRTAFRNLAREHHPDINPTDPSAEERFKDLNEAYEVLSDPEKRKLYDRFGEDWQRYKEAGFTGDESSGGGRETADFGTWFRGRHPGGTFTRTEFSERAGERSDFFETLFGGLTGRRNSRWATRATRPRRGQDSEASVEISLDEAFRGTSRRFDVQAQDACPTCGGTGIVRSIPCPTCDGAGTIPRSKTIEVRIPAGVATGSRVRVAGQGGGGDAGGPPGDVYLNVSVRPDSRFARDGDNLKIDLEIPLYTALLGGEVSVPTLTGAVSLKIPPETQQGRIFRLRGQGMSKLRGKDGDRGDLMARAAITIPTNLSSQERELFERLRGLHDGRKP